MTKLHSDVEERNSRAIRSADGNSTGSPAGTRLPGHDARRASMPRDGMSRMRSIFMSRSEEEALALQKRMEALRGQTIDPAVATKIMARSRAVEFDGFGRILSFSKGTVSPKLLTKLEAAVIKPLATTNTRIQRDAPRTEREILTRAMHLLGTSHSLANQMLRDDAKQLFLSGSLTRESVAAFVKKATGVLGQAGDVLMEDQFNMQEHLLHVLAINLRKKTRPWYNHSPSLQQFMSSPSMDTLKACLAETSNGVEAVKVPSIATWMAVIINTREGIEIPGWLRDANSFYDAVVVPEKPTQKSDLHGVVAQAPGNWLHYHPKPTTIDNGMTGSNETHKKVHSPSNLSRFEVNALSTGQTVVSGPSGTPDGLLRSASGKRQP
ncbi:MAG: hypothetical protein JF606_24520 [Burkholderiales bacterium]|nr:hypothetical protein [Burkholderiales bacterium]